MRIKIQTLFFLCLVLLCAPSAIRAKEPGKFYIVGMGTTPDLIAVRGVEVIKSSQIIIVGGQGERNHWKDYILDKEVWYSSNALRRMYGVDPNAIKDPKQRETAEKANKDRQEFVERIRAAVQDGKNVAFLQSGDPMMYGQTFMLEMLPKDFPSEIVPGIGAFQAASAAVKMSPPYGYDTNGVILALAEDWPGRADVNEKLMATGSTMAFYTMGVNYPELFAQLARHYPADTPVAVVANAGNRQTQKVTSSTVGQFLRDVDYKNLGTHMLLVGKFLTAGQARKDFMMTNAEHGD